MTQRQNVKRASVTKLGEDYIPRGKKKDLLPLPFRETYGKNRTRPTSTTSSRVVNPLGRERRPCASNRRVHGGLSLALNGLGVHAPTHKSGAQRNQLSQIKALSAYLFLLRASYASRSEAIFQRDRKSSGRVILNAAVPPCIAVKWRLRDRFPGPIHATSFLASSRDVDSSLTVIGC